MEKAGDCESSFSKVMDWITKGITGKEADVKRCHSWLWEDVQDIKLPIEAESHKVAKATIDNETVYMKLLAFCLCQDPEDSCSEKDVAAQVKVEALKKWEEIMHGSGSKEASLKNLAVLVRQSRQSQGKALLSCPLIEALISAIKAARLVGNTAKLIRILRDLPLEGLISNMLLSQKSNEDSRRILHLRLLTQLSEIPGIQEDLSKYQAGELALSLIANSASLSDKPEYTLYLCSRILLNLFSDFNPSIFTLFTRKHSAVDIMTLVGYKDPQTQQGWQSQITRLFLKLLADEDLLGTLNLEDAKILAQDLSGTLDKLFSIKLIISVLKALHALVVSLGDCEIVRSIAAARSLELLAVHPSLEIVLHTLRIQKYLPTKA